MGFFDNAQDMLGRGATAAQGVLDKGVSAAKGAVSGVAVEQQLVMKNLVRLCADGWAAGWHQGFDGAVTARMDDAEVAPCRPFFYDNPSSWVSMGIQDARLAGAFFATTGLRTSMRNVALDPARNIGIIEVNEEGDAWRIVWGLKDGGVPTMAFPQHFAAHADNRVVYSCVPANIAAARLLLPSDDRAVTKVLWGALPQAMAVAPRGVAVLDVPVTAVGDVAAKLAERSAVVLSDGGVVTAGLTFDDAFAIAQALDKAAGIYLSARAANGGSGAFASAATADQLRTWAHARNAEIDESLLV